MKRIWFAVIFLCLAFSLCVFEQVQIHTFYREMHRMVAEAKADEQKNDLPRLQKSIEEIKNYWNERNGLLYTMTNHGALDELSKDIRALDPDKPDNGLNKISASLEIFYENQRITLSNIF